MGEEDKQAVATDTDTQVTPVVEETGAPDTQPDDLDTLLAEFNAGTVEPSPEPQVVTPPDNSDIRSEIEELKQTINRQDQAKECADLAQGVRDAGGLDPVAFDDNVIIGIVDQMAKTDASLRNAWLKTTNDPKARAKLVAGLGHSLGKRFSKSVDQNATSDREAVAAAVRGHSTPAPQTEAPDYTEMSNNEFRDSVKKKYGFNVPI